MKIVVGVSPVIEGVDGRDRVSGDEKLYPGNYLSVHLRNSVRHEKMFGSSNGDSK